MSELGARPNYDFVPRRGRNGRENWTSRNSASELSNPLENGKKTIQAFESLNFNVRARS